MAHIVTGLFTDSKKAGDAIADLKQKGFTKDISVISKNSEWEGTDTHQIKSDATEGATAGAVVGAAIGGLSALLAGVTALVVPGVGLIIAGPLAAAVTTAAVGAVTGGIVGALVDAGIPDETAKLYEGRINAGDVLVAVSADHDKEDDVFTLLNSYGAMETTVAHTDR